MSIALGVVDLRQAGVARRWRRVTQKGRVAARGDTRAQRRDSGSRGLGGLEAPGSARAPKRRRELLKCLLRLRLQGFAEVGGAHVVKMCKLPTTSTRPPPASPSAPSAPPAPAAPRPTAYGPVVMAVVKARLALDPVALGADLPSPYGKSLNFSLGFKSTCEKLVAPTVGYERLHGSG